MLYLLKAFMFVDESSYVNSRYNCDDVCTKYFNYLLFQLFEK